MLPTLQSGDMILINKWFRWGQGVRVGDLVQLRGVVDPADNILKRVVGMPGDLVSAGGDLEDEEAEMIQVGLQMPGGGCGDVELTGLCMALGPCRSLLCAGR